MSSYFQSPRGPVAAMLIAAFAVLCSAGTPAQAQDQTSNAPAPHPITNHDRTFPRWEIFGGYSFLYPGANLHYINPGATLPVSLRQESNPRGVGASLTYNFTRWLGVTGDFSGDWGDGEGGPDLAAGYIGTLDDSNLYTASIGPKLTYRKAHFAPFIEGLVGWQRLHSEYTGIGSSDSIGYMGGGGIDVPLTRHFGLRLIQGDYVYSNHRFGPSATVPTTELRGVRLQSGATFMFGGMAKPEPVGYSCSANPAEVFPGDPVTVTGSAINLNPKKTATYGWTTTGGKASGTSSIANIDTAGLAPGSYTVAGHVTEGAKAGQSADCTAGFTVKPFGPPTIACSANPSTLNPGDSTTITAQGSSPQNRPLSYSYSSPSGQISGSTASATLNTNGVAPGEITVTCNVVDDMGQTASATTTVTINPPAASPVAKTEALCTIDFGRDKRRPSRVNNEGKACLDDVALNLQRSSDARFAIVGNSGPAETRGSALAAERAVNTRAYLIEEKGIDPSRIEVRTGNAGTPSVQNYLVPSGANFANDVPDTSPVDMSTVKASRNANGHRSSMGRHHGRTRKSVSLSSK
jgi:outer membrane protein OmpA-like peptidoglycan-associated protein